MKREFQEIKEWFARQNKPIFSTEDREAKDRYFDIGPFAENRVVLSDNRYINASYITVSFIFFIFAD
jgi:protein tyrosine phosphatase